MLRTGRRVKIAVAGVLLLAVAAIGGTALAGAAGSVKTFTGCLVAGDGVIVKVKEGDSPKVPCAKGETLARLSGGDITRISVSGGLTLPNGGESGDVQIALDPTYSLPQGCGDGQVAKWNDATDSWACRNDADTTYTNGTGLSLAGGQFSIAADYRVKNTPDCGSGTFATGFDASGEIQCAAPTGGLQTFQARQTSFVAGDGLPDDGLDHTIVTLPVPAGTYFVTGKGVLKQGDDDVGFRPKDAFGCRLANLPQEQSAFFGLDNEEGEYGFALAGVVATTGAPLKLDCYAAPDLDLISVAYGTLVALKVG